MKTKLKKFYNDHRNHIDPFVTGLLIGGSFIATMAHKKAKGEKISDAALFKDETSDTMFLKVDFKNGRSDCYLWNPERVD